MVVDMYFLTEYILNKMFYKDLCAITENNSYHAII